LTGIRANAQESGQKDVAAGLQNLIDYIQPMLPQRGKAVTRAFSGFNVFGYVSGNSASALLRATADAALYHIGRPLRVIDIDPGLAAAYDLTWQDRT
jgi:hypothetical protein